MTDLLASSINAAMIADLACVVFIAIFGLISLSRGFVKQVLGLVTGIGSILLAVFFCDELVTLVNNWWGLKDKLAGSLLKALGDNKALTLPLSTENIQSAIAALGLPQFIADFAKNLDLSGAAATVGEYLANMFAGHILTAGAFVVIFIVAKLLLSIVKKLLQMIVSLPVIHGVDRLLGLLLGLVKGFLFLYIVIYIIGIIPPSISFMNVVREAINDSTIGAFMMNKNLFAMIMNWAMSLIPTK